MLPSPPPTNTPAETPAIKIDPLTQDTYTYVNGNPLNFTDPTGHMLACVGPASEQQAIGQAAEISVRAHRIRPMRPNSPDYDSFDGDGFGDTVVGGGA